MTRWLAVAAICLIGAALAAIVGGLFLGFVYMLLMAFLEVF